MNKPKTIINGHPFRFCTDRLGCQALNKMILFYNGCVNPSTGKVSLIDFPPDADSDGFGVISMSLEHVAQITDALSYGTIIFPNMSDREKESIYCFQLAVLKYMI